MSTRSNVYIRVGGELHQYYHHMDGYLDGVGYDLAKYLKNSLKVDKDPYEFLLQQMREEGYYEYEGELFEPHGDIEYMYLIDFQDDFVGIGYNKRNPGDSEVLETFPNVGSMERFIDAVNAEVFDSSKQISKD